MKKFAWTHPSSADERQCSLGTRLHGAPVYEDAVFCGCMGAKQCGCDGDAGDAVHNDAVFMHLYAKLQQPCVAVWGTSSAVAMAMQGTLR